MSTTYQLPPEYQWRHEGTQHTLHLGNRDLIRVDPVRAGWIVQSIFEVPGLALQRFAVRSVESGRRHAMRWTWERQSMIARACGRDDLASPAIAPDTPSLKVRRPVSPISALL
jgi:hypothetical protein